MTKKESLKKLSSLQYEREQMRFKQTALDNEIARIMEELIKKSQKKKSLFQRLKFFILNDRKN